MIIGSKFSRKYHKLLIKIGELSGEKTNKEISVKHLNKDLNMDRTEIKNALEYLEELGYIHIKTIGGPLLYGHITITEAGLQKYHSL
jgi:Mn-dependent DtxR family transcriptional regulator